MNKDNKIQRRLWLGIGMWLYVIAVLVWFVLDDSISKMDYFMRIVMVIIFAIAGTDYLYQWKKAREQN
ncbi:MAG: hypothetical protein LCH58_09600 [Bacteroidetes bacterium]|jgi:hypothetical protein|uniref:hypothetical protein n=1 Tax=Phnomibacter sp. TaxID=2836217 RepID=UPI002FDEBA2A|nr:hypothetical protein [Bacteroidota bacterium]